MVSFDDSDSSSSPLGGGATSLDVKTVIDAKRTMYILTLINEGSFYAQQQFLNINKIPVSLWNDFEAGFVSISQMYKPVSLWDVA